MLSEVENQCATTARLFGDGWQRSRMLTALADKQLVTLMGHFLLVLFNMWLLIYQYIDTITMLIQTGSSESMNSSTR